MSINTIGANGYADLGDAWIRYQTALLNQKQIQFGRHFRIEVDALLARAAAAARAARPAIICPEDDLISTDTTEVLVD